MPNQLGTRLNPLLSKVEGVTPQSIPPGSRHSYFMYLFRLDLTRLGVRRGNFRPRYLLKLTLMGEMARFAVTGTLQLSVTLTLIATGWFTVALNTFCRFVGWISMLFGVHVAKRSPGFPKPEAVPEPG